MSAVAQAVLDRCRPMQRDDIAEVSAIEARAYQFPWTEGIFRDCLRVGYSCRVIENEGGVAGYGILSVAAGEAHILNLCIAPERRRRGNGRMLLDHLIEVSRRARAKQILLEVRPSNLDARQLYGDAGFREVGRRVRYYQAADGREDAIVLGRELVPE